MICKTFDKEYFEEKTYWIAELSNGETVYQDDGKNENYEHSAWIRLKKYIEDNNLSINKFYVRFRSNIIYPLQENCDGYFFSIGIIGMMSSEENVNFYILGYVLNNKVMIKKIKIPELIVFDEEEREISNCSEQQLILNKKEIYGERKI